MATSPPSVLQPPPRRPHVHRLRQIQRQRRHPLHRLPGAGLFLIRITFAQPSFSSIKDRFTLEVLDRQVRKGKINQSCPSSLTLSCFSVLLAPESIFLSILMKADTKGSVSPISANRPISVMSSSSSLSSKLRVFSSFINDCICSAFWLRMIGSQ